MAKVRILSRARVRGASLLMLGGCAAGQHAARQSRDYPTAGVATVVRGYYRRAFEVSAFLPCPGPGVSAAFDSVRRAAPGGASRVDAFVEVNAAVERSPVMAPLPPRDAGGADFWFVVWRGRFSPPGSTAPLRRRSSSSPWTRCSTRGRRDGAIATDRRAVRPDVALRPTGHGEHQVATRPVASHGRAIRARRLDAGS